MSKHNPDIKSKKNSGYKTQSGQKQEQTTQAKIP